MARDVRTEVYNLEFPSWTGDVTVGEFRFTRHPDYLDRLGRLQHHVTVHSETSVSQNFDGANVITATVDGPDSPSVIYGAKARGLDDLQLLLSIFTLRDVHAVLPNTPPWNLDPRSHQYGGLLRCSIPYRSDGPKSAPADRGLSDAVNAVVAKLGDPAWQAQYDNGHFVRLANAAFKVQPLESSFTQCWTIWEHLFAAHHKKWISHKRIQNIASADKIAFLLCEYGLRESVSAPEHKVIEERLVGIRNRIIHAGRFPDEDDVEQILFRADLFCRLTEYVIARIFGLEPSEVYSTTKEFNRLMNGEELRTWQKLRTQKAG